MIANVQLFLLWLVISVILYALTPRTLPRVRQGLLILLSAVLIYAVAPWSALICLGLSITTFLFSRLFSWRRHWSLSLLGVLLLVAPLACLRIYSNQSFLITLGVTFLTLKSIGALLDSYARKTRLKIGDVLLLNFFFPLYGAGPVEHVRSFVTEEIRRPVTLDNLISGGARVALGIFKAAFVCESILGPFLRRAWPVIYSDPHQYSVPSAYGYVLVKFLYAYINFSGYSDIAIGAGRMFSLKIVENFRWPILARSPQEFWRRWHISLGNWVMQYLFFPIFVTIKKGWGMQVALIISFFLIGLWHEASAMYVTWGILHGSAMALVGTVRQWGKNRPRYVRLQSHPAYIALCTILTVLFVSWVQAFANSPSWRAAVGMSLRLVGQ